MFFSIAQDFHYQSNIYASNNLNETKISSEVYPLQARVDQAGLTIVLQKSSLNPDDWKKCFEKTLVIHPSTVLPSSFKRSDFRKIQYGMTYDVEITPEITQSDKDLRNIKPAKRLCYFEGEKKLKYFKFYTQRNCELECLSRYTLWACDCVAWYMIRNSTMPICVYRKVDLVLRSCVSKSVDFAFDSDKFPFNVKKFCKCYPACNEFTYRERFHIRKHAR